MLDARSAGFNSICRFKKSKLQRWGKLSGEQALSHFFSHVLTPW